MKHIISIAVIVIAIVSVMVGQQRSLLYIDRFGNQEAIPLIPNEKTADAIQRHQLHFRSVTGIQTQMRFSLVSNSSGSINYDTLKYFSSPNDLTVNFGFTHQDVALQWYSPRSGGTVKEFWWYNYLNRGTVNKGTIRAWHIDPRVATLPTTPTTKYLGTFKDVADGDGGVQPFMPSSGNQWFYSNGGEDSTTYSFNFFTKEASWLPGGLQVTLDSNMWQGLKLDEWGDSMIVKSGELFGFTLSNDSRLSDFGSGTDTRLEILSWTNSVGAPFHSFKFYELGRSSPADAGWHMRGDYEWGMYVVMEYSGDPGPKIVPFQYGTTLQTTPRLLQATITDNNFTGGSVGVASAYLKYRIVPAALFDSTIMTSSGDIFNGYTSSTFPGATVEWCVTATDVNGNRSTSSIMSYKIFQQLNNILLLYNSSQYSSATAKIIYTDNAPNVDVWSLTRDGQADIPALLGLYQNVLLADGNFPQTFVYPAIHQWLNNGTLQSKRNLFFTSQDYGCFITNSCNDTVFAPGSWEYDYLGVSYLGPQDVPPYYHAYRFVPQSDKVTNYLLSYQSVNNTTLWYDPKYELQFDPWQDAFSITAGTIPLFRNAGGNYIHGARKSGATFNTAFLAFDPGALNMRSDTSLAHASDPKYKWINDIGSVAMSFFLTLNDSIPPPASITVLSPNGGEQLVAGTSHSIQWNSNGISNVNISYSTNAGVSWNTIAFNYPAGSVPGQDHAAVIRGSKFRDEDLLPASAASNSYLWMVPTTLSSQCLLRIADAANGSLFDISNSYFSIVSIPPPSVNWSRQYFDTTRDIQIIKGVDSLTAWASGVNCVLRTTNGGSTWTNAFGDLPQGRFFGGLEAKNSFEAWVGSDQGTIYHTTNGGVNWISQYSISGSYIDGIIAIDATTLVAYGDPVLGNFVILRSINGGTSWTVNSSIAEDSSGEFGWYKLDKIGTTLRFTTNHGRIIQSNDNGINWFVAGKYRSDDITNISFSDPNNGMFTGKKGSIFRTTNGGTTWNAVTTPVISTLWGCQFIKGTSTGWAVGSAGVILKTNDYGVNWSVDNSGTIVSLYGVSFPDMYTGWVVGLNIILKYLPTTNFNATMFVSQKVVDFLATRIGFADELSVTIENSFESQGNLSGAVSISGFGSDFSLVSGGGIFTLAPNQSRTVVIRYNAINAGFDHALLVIGNNSTNMPHTYSIPVIGFGVPLAAHPKKILLDRTHGFSTNEIDTVYFESLFTLLRTAGHVVVTGQNNFSLSGFDCLLSITQRDSFSVSEISQVQNFVTNGGALVMLGDNSGSFGSSRQNALLRHSGWNTGIRMDSNLVLDSSQSLLGIPHWFTVTNFAQQSGLFYGVDSLGVFASASVSVLPPAQVLMTTSTGGTSQLMAKIQAEKMSEGILKNNRYEEINPSQSMGSDGGSPVFIDQSVKNIGGPTAPSAYAVPLAAKVSIGNGNIVVIGDVNIFSRSFAVIPGVSSVGLFYADNRVFALNLFGEINDTSIVPIIDLPKIVSVHDVPNDNGKQVRVVWTYSPSPAQHGVTKFAIWRRDVVRTFVQELPTLNDTLYSAIVPTLYDSTKFTGMRYSAFQVSAHTLNPGIYSMSVPDSGYSLDNIYPQVPTNLHVIANSGTQNTLIWKGIPDDDLLRYNVYRGVSPSFVIDQSSYIGKTIDTMYVDDVITAGVKYYYRITAVDFSGNESKGSDGVTSVQISGSVIPTVFSLDQNYPNPFNPRTTITFGVPVTSSVRLTVYNTLGQLVTILEAGLKSPGMYLVEWGSTTVASGIYLYRIEAEDVNNHQNRFISTKRMVLMK